MNEKVDVKEGCERLSFLFVAVKWQDNNVIYTVYYVQILYLCMMGEQGVHIKALNTGHDGSLSTGHANSPKDMISRLETMVLMGMDLPLPAIERQIASGLDIIVHLGRLRDKSRKVLEVTEVLGYWDGQIHLQTMYRYEEIRKEDENVTENEKKDQENKVHGEWKKVAELFHREKLVAAGYYI